MNSHELISKLKDKSEKQLELFERKDMAAIKQQFSQTQKDDFVIKKKKVKKTNNNETEVMNHTSYDILPQRQL